MRELTPELQAEHDRFIAQSHIYHRGFSIHPVSFREQPYYRNGKHVFWGFYLLDHDGKANRAPGCVWFETVERAMKAADFIHQAGGYNYDDGSERPMSEWGNRFWELMNAKPSDRFKRVLDEVL